MKEVSVTVDARNGNGKAGVVFSFDGRQYPDTVDLSSGYQREQTIRRALQAFRLTETNLPALDAELVRLADAQVSRRCRHVSTKPPSFSAFPTVVSPSTVKEAVQEGAKALCCDEAFIAVPLLAGLAGAIGATRQIELKPGWVEPAVLWTCVIADSGSMKSPAMNFGLDPLRRLQAWKLQELPELEHQYERDKALHEADMSAWKRKGRAAGEPPPERPEEPSVSRYVVADITIEALADRLRESPRGLLCACDELSAWLGSFDAYRHKQQGGDVARWLSIHRAEPLLVDRKSGPQKTIFVDRAAVSVTGGIQPWALARALAKEHMENGLAARLLMAAPPRRSKKWTDTSVDPQLQRRMQVLFGRLLALNFAVDENGQAAPITVKLTPEAKAAWVTFYNEHAQALCEATGHQAAVLSKLEGAAARLALVVHVVESVADDPIVDPLAVDETSIDAGVTMARWFAREAERVYTILGETDEARIGREIIELVQRQGGVITARDLQRGMRRFKDSAEDAERALSDLVQVGLGTWEAVPASEQGGRPTRQFRVSTGVGADTTPENHGNGWGFVDAAAEDRP